MSLNYTDTLILGAAQLLKFIQKNRANVKEIKFIAPKIGSEDFGHFEVVVRNPYSLNTQYVRTKTRAIRESSTAEI